MKPHHHYRAEGVMQPTLNDELAAHFSNTCFSPNDVARRARALAAIRGHRYITLNHLLAASVFEHRELYAEANRRIEESAIPASPTDPIFPSDDFSRVMGRLTEGVKMFDALRAEASDSWAFELISKVSAMPHAA